uniref:Uncharacterized protein n=1 Tax=Tanacetum cinerariifolium TaxID=118510 RepID=A0A6L2NYV4_TANCI|nr:hypothetical protein [Tanacetum cinerariifolium]
MKLYKSSHLRQPFASLTTLTFPTSPHLTHLQSIITQIKHISKAPQNPTSLDSLLAKTHLLNPSNSLIIVDFLSQINKLSRAKTIISYLKSRKLANDVFLYSLVFNYVVKDGSINDVENAWQEIYGSVKRFDFFYKYVVLVCKNGSFEEIKAVYDRVVINGGVDVLEGKCYGVLCVGLCDVNEGFLAKTVVEVMWDKGMVVNDWTYFSMFQCFCRNGVFDEADLVLRRLVKNGFVLDICVYGSFLYGLCKAGKDREANKLFKKLLKRVPVRGVREGDVVLREGRRAIFQLKCEGVMPEIMVYECYFRALCNAGKLDEAEVLLKKMLSGRILPEICVYGSFIKALFRAGRDDDAMKFFKNQRKKGLVSVDEIGRYVIMGLCEKGIGDDAFRLFNEIKTVNNFVNSSDVCNSILDSYWKESSAAKAGLFFEKWQLDEGKYGRPNVITYTIMLNGYCNDNDVSKALVVFEEMLKRKVVNGAVYERIIKLLCSCGRVHEALKYLNDSIENGHFLFCKRWRVLFQSVFSMDECCVSVGS